MGKFLLGSPIGFANGACFGFGLLYVSLSVFKTAAYVEGRNERERERERGGVMWVDLQHAEK